MSKEHMISNPIIPGFYPDPSICRVGDDFYLACSSFEMYPGIPIFHSRDLANWEQISYAMYQENGFHTTANMGTGGVMAPTIRYNNGTFYIINCNFADKGNFYVTAKDPRGPWSEPHWITDIPDIDCSLFFDNDGTSYLVSPGNDETEDNGRAFFLTPYDLDAGRACGERKKIWNSALRKAWAPEAPHIYHIGDWYYLLIAEGGTEHYHSAMIARSSTVDGWYEGYAGNPIITHRHLGWEYPIDNVGHADFVDTPDGNWYAVMLASRIIDGQHKNFGRETYICPVKWERGWPVLSPGSGRMEFSYPADDRLPWTPYPGEPERDDFDTPELGLHFSFWGVPYQDFWRVEDGSLKLKCLPRPIIRQLKGFNVAEPDQSRDDCISLLGRRQRDTDFDVTMSLDFIPKGKEAAGLIVMQAANHQFRLEKTLSNGKEVLRLIMVTTKQEGLPFLPGYKADTTEQILEEKEVPAGKLILRMEVRRQAHRFFFGCDENNLTAFETVGDGALINPEEVGGMIGTIIAMFATANGDESDNWAKFDFFEMKKV